MLLRQIYVWLIFRDPWPFPISVQSVMELDCFCVFLLACTSTAEHCLGTKSWMSSSDIYFPYIIPVEGFFFLDLDLLAVARILDLVCVEVDSNNLRLLRVRHLFCRSLFRANTSLTFFVLLLICFIFYLQIYPFPQPVFVVVFCFVLNYIVNLFYTFLRNWYHRNSTFITGQINLKQNNPI